MIIKIIFKLFGLMVLFASAVVAWLWMDFHHFLQTPVDIASEQRSFEIKPGVRIDTIAKQLSQQHLVSSQYYFSWLARIRQQTKHIKAGEYVLPEAATPEQLLAVFVKGKTRQYSLTLIEGWNFKQFIAAVKASPHLQHELEKIDNSKIMVKLGYEGKFPEGLFYPDTYHFPKGMSDIQFLQRAYQSMQTVLNDEWRKRQPGLPIDTAYEALILASIVEKETGLKNEHARVASVFINRLKKKMKLQTDPTVIYGMGDQYKGNIRRKDLKKDTPYNTYVHKGLPPTPIAMPGKAAIHASLHPAAEDYLYFVATGTGGHTFSKTLGEHNKAVKRYLKQLKKAK
jgi:UPF0755 protein